MSNHSSSGDDEQDIEDGVDYSSLFESEPFNTLDDAFNWCVNVALNNGFSIIKSSSRRSTTTGLFVKWWTCDRFGDRRKKEVNAVRNNTVSKKCECTFKLRVGERFTIDHLGNISRSCWVLTMSDGFHNYKMINYAVGHRRKTAFDVDEIEYIEKQVLAQVPPAKISLGLHMRTPEKPRPTMKQLYNIGAKIRSEIRAVRNPAQHMLASATEAGYVQYREVNNETSQLTHIFMVHPEAIRMYRSYKFVVGISSTYNTNEYKFPLVEMIGMTPTNHNFTIAYAIMEGENKEDYVWMLEKLRSLLPDGVFPTIIVTDRELLTGALAAMNKKWPSMVDYIQRTWLIYREKFLKLYTNTITHYGNTSTSRVESTHAVLKEWLHSAGLSVDTIWTRFYALMEGQHVEIRKVLEDSRSKSRKDKFGRLFNLLKGNVSIGMELGYRLDEGCIHAMRTTHGLPCACDLHRLSTRERRVHLDSIDAFWRTLVYEEHMALPPGDEGTLEELLTFICNINSPTRRRCTEAIYTELHPEDDYVEEPVVNENPRGRPRSSNARNLSGFEHSCRRS
ncbi:hypothetical protein RND81_11G059500 [Saponaria officinalis]|uniref:MULE transposase domain-containing protein n=1 Tax=Saponaria officinalis TaxID=3572 RepID=A0AAW1HID6_SAPOF